MRASEWYEPEGVKKIKRQCHKSSKNKKMDYSKRESNFFKYTSLRAYSIWHKNKIQNTEIENASFSKLHGETCLNFSFSPTNFLDAFLSLRNVGACTNQPNDIDYVLE
jgi:hypothetical protein